jgi:hypothetical protein
MRSIKESEAKNRNGLFEPEDDGLGVRSNEDKKFKIMSDQTARTLSRIREKAGGFLKKNTVRSELSERSVEKPDFARQTEDLRSSAQMRLRPSGRLNSVAQAAVWVRPAPVRILLIAGAIALMIAATITAFAIVSDQKVGVAIDGRALSSVKNESAVKTIVQDARRDLYDGNRIDEIVIDEDLPKMKDDAPVSAEGETPDREALEE